MTMDDRALAELLARQCSVLTRSQALAVGLNVNRVQYRSRSGGPWQRLLPGVYLTLSGQPTREQLEVAAVLYAGPASVITGVTALRTYDIDCPQTSTVNVLVPERQQRVSAGFVVVRRTRRMPKLVLTNGVCAFALPSRAVADALDSVTRLADARTIVAGAVQQRRCTIHDLRQELAYRRGRGSVLLRQVLAEVADGMRSAPECELGDLIRESGLPTPYYNPRLYVNGKFLAQPDAWWPQASVAVEVDSVRWHLLPEDWGRTMARHRQIAAAGIVVLHISPHQLRTERQEVLRDIAAALEAGRPATGIVTRRASA